MANEQLSVEFTAELGQLERAAKRAEATLNGVDRNARTNTASVHKSFDTLGAAGVRSFNRLTVAVAGYASVSSAINYTATVAGLEDQARAAQLTTDQFQRLVQGARILAGVDIAGPLATFSKQASLARIGTGDLIETLKFASPELARQLQSARGTGEALVVFAEAVRRLSSEQDRAVLVQKAFGEQATALVPLLSRGAAGLAEMTAEADKFGAKINSDAIASTKALRSEVGLLADALGERLVHAFRPIADGIARGAKYARENIGTLDEAIGSLAVAAGSVVVPAANLAMGLTDIAGPAKSAKSRLDGISASAAMLRREWTATVEATSGKGLRLNARPDFRGQDAVSQSRAQLAAARGETLRSIELEGRQALEAAKRLNSELALSDAEYSEIRRNTVAATEAKVTELRRSTNDQLRAFEIATLQATQQNTAAIQLEYQADYDNYKRLLEQKVISQKQFDDAIANAQIQLAAKTAEENKRVIEEARQKTAEFEAAIRGPLDSALRTTLEGGKVSAQSFFLELTRGLANAIIQAQLLKPLLDGLFNNSGGSNAIANVFSALATSAGGIPARAEGGGVRAGVPHLVGERGRPEVFVPSVPGSVQPLERFGRGMGGGASGSAGATYNIDARGASVGVEQRIYAALAQIERSRPSPVEAVSRTARQFPTRRGG